LSQPSDIECCGIGATLARILCLQPDSFLSRFLALPHPDNAVFNLASLVQPGPAALTDGLDAIVKALWPALPGS
jgi:hypothetical protein